MKQSIGKLLIALSCVVFLGAFEVSCNDQEKTLRFAGPEPVVHLSPAGIYRGNFTTSVGAQPVALDVTGAVSEQDDVQFIFAMDEERHYAGMVGVDGTSLTGTLTEYRGALGRFLGIGGADTATLDGTVEESVAIFGDYSGALDEGRFNLQYDAAYETASSIDLTTGVWVFNMASPGGGVYNVTWDIDIDGLIFGTDSMGCVFLGNADIIDSRFNAYRLTVDVSTCGVLNGEYSGLAFLSPTLGTDLDRMTLSISNSAYAFATILDK